LSLKLLACAASGKDIFANQVALRGRRFCF